MKSIFTQQLDFVQNNWNKTPAALILVQILGIKMGEVFLDVPSLITTSDLETTHHLHILKQDYMCTS